MTDRHQLRYQLFVDLALLVCLTIVIVIMIVAMADQEEPNPATAGYSCGADGTCVLFDSGTVLHCVEDSND